MKATIRLTIGLISSLLLSAGFSRAAVRLDPLGHQLNGPAQWSDSEQDDPTPACTLPCQYEPAVRISGLPQAAVNSLE